jgi:hypothetical protein
MFLDKTKLLFLPDSMFLDKTKLLFLPDSMFLDNTKLSFLPEIKPRSPGCPTRSAVTVMTELPRLHVNL